MAHKEYKKDDIIDAIVKMRIEKMASTKTIIQEFLMGELGYGQAYAYRLYKESREKIVELYDRHNTAALEEALAQLEGMLQDARHAKNYKLALEIRKEISKLLGHYVNKVDITTQGEKLDGFIVKIIRPDASTDTGDDSFGETASIR